jgi:SAM-dependent methyltransferase
MAASDFNDLTDAYEAMVDWPKRLSREAPFFNRWFERIGAATVLDVACGTGHHAAMFHASGLRVEAADISPAMIERAHSTFGNRPDLCWIVRSFEEPPPQKFDAIICIGNSLALCADLETVRRSITTMMSAARDGGIVVIQVLNLRRFPDGPCVWQKHIRTTIHEHEVLIVKGIHRCGQRGFVDVIVSPIDDPTLTRSESIPLLSLELEQLQGLLQQAGATSIQAYGDYEDRPFAADVSGDLILVAQK